MFYKLSGTFFSIEQHWCVFKAYVPPPELHEHLSTSTHTYIHTHTNTQGHVSIAALLLCVIRGPSRNRTCGDSHVGGFSQSAWRGAAGEVSAADLSLPSLPLSARSCLHWPGMAVECSGLLIATPLLSWGRAASSHSLRSPAELSLLRVIWRCPQPVSKHTPTNIPPHPTLPDCPWWGRKSAQTSPLLPYAAWTVIIHTDSGRLVHLHIHPAIPHPVSFEPARGVFLDLGRQSGI